MMVFTERLRQSVGDVTCTDLDIVDDRAVERDGKDVNLSLSPVEPAVTVVTASSATVAIIENDNDGKHVLYCANLLTIAIVCLIARTNLVIPFFGSCRQHCIEFYKL